MSPTHEPAAPGGLDDWVVEGLLPLIGTDDDVVVFGPRADAVVAALAARGRAATAAGPMSPSTPSEIVGSWDAGGPVPDVVVLADVLSWVTDEVAILRELRPLAARTRVVATAPNASWWPRRVELLAGRSPFGSGPVSERPLRFYTRDTLLDAATRAGVALAELRPVSSPGVVDPGSGVGPELVAEVRSLADADVAGFVAVMGEASGAGSAVPIGVSGVEPEEVERLVLERFADDIRDQEARRAEVEASAAARIARLEAKVRSLEAAREELERDAGELEEIRARLGYRALVRAEGVARRLPLVLPAWRRIRRVLARRGVSR